MAFVLLFVTYKRHDKSLRILLYYFGIGIIFTLVEGLLAKQSINNLFMLHTFTLIEALLIGYVYYEWMSDMKIRKWYKTVLIVFGLLWFASKFTFENVMEFDNITATLEVGLLSLIILINIYKWLQQDIIPEFFSPQILISLGFLIQFTGSFVVFAFSNVLTVWTIYNIVSIISRIIISGGILTLRNQ
ncbi:MAG: hypothetical protein HQ509_05730 [Candidatus Marinimicrobia bacterium]|nr:hypothetical protein [Candidatus Neomarinimicrobiota bacterium]